MSMRQTTFSQGNAQCRTDPLSRKKIKTAQIALTCPCIFASSFNTVITFANKSNQSNKSLSSQLHKHKHMHEHKANNEKHPLDKIDHKHIRFPIDTIAKLCDKKLPTQQNRSISFKTKTPN